MRRFKCAALLLLAAVLIRLLAGCTGQEPVQDPVSIAPEWTVYEQEQVGQTVPEINVYMDLTQSMFGFSGLMDSPIGKAVVALTDLARFDEHCTTLTLEPDEQKDLHWEQKDPLVVAAAVLNRDKVPYTYQGGFPDAGGPLCAVFRDAPDPDEVRVLITDLLEQESKIAVLRRYAEKLFEEDSRQQIRIYVADSPYDGLVSYPVVVGEELKVWTTEYTGIRPFAIIVAGPAEGVEKTHQLLTGTGVDFAMFMAENKRPDATGVVFAEGQCLTQNILVEAFAQAKCTVNLEALPGMADCFAYRYKQVSADHTQQARLSLIAQQDDNALEGVAGPRELSLGNVIWQEWTASEAEDGNVTYSWQTCAGQPAGVTCTLAPMQPGSAVAERDAAQSGLEDIVIPAGQEVRELSVLLGAEAAGKAYSLQAQVMVSAGENPSASTGAFKKWDIPFATYRQAPGDPTILERIPDLCLLLSSLAELDDNSASIAVGEVRIMIQNYETVNMEEVH